MAKKFNDETSLVDDGAFKVPDRPVSTPYSDPSKKEVTADARPSVRGPIIEALSDWARICAAQGCPIDGARLAVPVQTWHRIRAELKKTLPPGKQNLPWDTTVKLLLPGGWLEVGEFRNPKEPRSLIQPA